MRYALLIRLLLPFFFVALWLKGRREPGWRRGWGERLGRLPGRADRPLWLHAASVGEANSAAGLLRELQARWPDLPLHLTAFTPTGRDRLCALAPGASVSLLPVDVPLATNRFLRALAPRAAVMLETECWPNLLAGCACQGVPVIWLSGRMSERSAVQYPKIFGRRNLRRVFSQVRALGMQTQRDARRFVEVGAPPARVSVTGSLKFDLPVAADLSAEAELMRLRWQRSAIWLAASTHAGEELAVLDAHRAVLARAPDALLLLAPRHPRRAAEVERLLVERGMNFVSRSSGAGVDQAQVLLIDTLGELMLFFAACELAFVGGSLVPVGGHNLLEPAALARPILTGPHLDSCRDVADALLEAEALRVVPDAQALADALLDWLSAPGRWRAQGRAGQEFAERNRGAVDASLKLLAPYLN